MYCLCVSNNDIPCICSYFYFHYFSAVYRTIMKLSKYYHNYSNKQLIFTIKKL